MRCFFFDPDQQTGDRILITGSEARHITTVLRMQPGTTVELFDGKGSIITGEILQLTSREVLFRMLSRSTQHNSAAPLTLVQAMLKGKKMDFLIQKSTELGVHTFIPLITRYCEKRSHGKQQLDRWQRIMFEACKQCRRPVPMRIKEPVSIELLALPENSSLIMGWEDEDSQPLSPALLRSNHPTLLLIGPEGGFHADEVSLARDLGFSTVSLGPRTLRAETAALAATSVVQYLSNNLEPHRSE
ncbi:MAG TPA: 16S rRNA (uracil(1498)-N(3))-methyltransferase [Spirochaeta sp.]|nr:16S rRNA (uracil(1498)-N(3))-methyltransferase [Spirochaeta sp.]